MHAAYVINYVVGEDYQRQTYDISCIYDIFFFSLKTWSPIPGQDSKKKNLG
jgi:hypothetical protein